MQPHLYKPPGAIDTRNLLAGVHQKGGLMKHMVYTPSEILSKGNEMTSSQIFSQCNMVQGWLIGLATEDKSA
jgi:hypothetical protein